MTEPDVTWIHYPCPRCEDDGPHQILHEEPDKWIQIRCRNPLCKNEFEVKV